MLTVHLESDTWKYKSKSKSDKWMEYIKGIASWKGDYTPLMNVTFEKIYKNKLRSVHTVLSKPVYTVLYVHNKTKKRLVVCEWASESSKIFQFIIQENGIRAVV